MSDYTPTTDEVRSRYKAGAWLKGDRNPDQFNPSIYEPAYFAEFDRWLSEVERKAAEETWNEAVDYLSRHWEDVAPKAVADLEQSNPYRKEK